LRIELERGQLAPGRGADRFPQGGKDAQPGRLRGEAEKSPVAPLLKTEPSPPRKAVKKEL